MEVNILLIKCPSAHNTFGVRIQKMSDGDWWRTWAFKLNLKQARSEGYDETKVEGSLNVTEEYPGCPYCGETGFVQCGQCQKLSCHHGDEATVCPWCQNEMTNFVTVSKFDVTTGRF